MTRVLIVDDSPTETYKMTDILSRHGYEVITAQSGEEGVEVAKKETANALYRFAWSAYR